MAIARVFLVHVVSADATVRSACRQKLRDLGYATAAFADARDFVAASLDHRPDCLVIDQGVEENAALDLQSSVQEAERRIPVVCMAAHATAPQAVRAMKAGAVDFLCMPFATEDLARAVAAAVEAGRRWREEDVRRAQARALVARLTPREQAVFALVLDGMLNKQIACCLGSSEATVKVHRSRLMRKLEVRSLVDLIRLGHELDRATGPAQAVAPRLPAPRPLPLPRASGPGIGPAPATPEAWRETA